MKTLLLAAGRGERLRPLTDSVPKVLLPVGGVPLLDHTLRWLASQGVTEVVVNLHHLRDQIREFAGDGTRYGLVVSYSPEERLLGTAGAARRVADQFDDTFVVVYGDVLTNMHLRDMIRWHLSTAAWVTIAVVPAEDATGKGVVEVDQESRIRSFVEKPSGSSVSECLINAGIYLLEPQVLRHIDEGFSDFGADVFPEFLRLGIPMYAWRLRTWEYLLDIGTPAAYRQAQQDAAEHKVRVG